MESTKDITQNSNQLFEDLLASYNKLVRPVENDSDTLVVYFKLKLSQLLDVVSSKKKKNLNLFSPHFLSLIFVFFFFCTAYTLTNCFG